METVAETPETPPNEVLSLKTKLLEVRVLAYLKTYVVRQQLGQLSANLGGMMSSPSYLYEIPNKTQAVADKWNAQYKDKTCPVKIVRGKRKGEICGEDCSRYFCSSRFDLMFGSGTSVPGACSKHGATWLKSFPDGQTFQAEINAAKAEDAKAHEAAREADRKEKQEEKIKQAQNTKEHINSINGEADALLVMAKDDPKMQKRIMSVKEAMLKIQNFNT